MFVQTLDESPRNCRGGQVSYLLLTKGQFGSGNLAVTWVEGGPRSEQPLHAHPANEQVYVIARGRGIMRVGGEEQEVAAKQINLSDYRGKWVMLCFYPADFTCV